MKEQMNERVSKGRNECRPIAEGGVGFDWSNSGLPAGQYRGGCSGLCVPDPRARHVFHESMNK